MTAHEEDFEQWEDVTDAYLAGDDVQSAASNRPRRKKWDPATQPIEIVHQDEHLVVIHKPAGVITTRGFHDQKTVLDRLNEQLGDSLDESLRLVHRLDADTSGVMVLARTYQAQRQLSRLWVSRRVEKTYLALVAGRPEADEGTVDLPLLKTPGSAKPVRVDRKRGKNAQTHFVVRQRYAGMALLEVHPRQGRMHQVRVHLAAVGLPLRVDALYGSGEPLLLSSFKVGYKPSVRRPERPLISRLTLHAWKLSFEHPGTGQMVEYVVEPAKDFSATVAQLDKHAMVH